jgi:restriction system protein
MTVPEYQIFMLPLLQLASDNQEHSLSETYDVMAQRFGINEQERNELLPSGRQSRFDNRVGWARTYLKKAGLIGSTTRGKFCITQRGLDVLKTKPARIDRELLAQFPEFREFQSKQDNRRIDDAAEAAEQTPEEILESSYQNLRHDLAQELLEHVKTGTPKFFENLVVDLLVAMGYGGSRKDAGQAVGQSHDGGIDGIIKEDRLGLDAVYIQAKKWEGTVGRQVVQAFAGSLAGQKARKGVMIATSQFSQEAKEYVDRLDMKIVLIDGEQLAQFMIEHGIGVAEVATYVVKKVDLDYFDEE